MEDFLDVCDSVDSAIFTGDVLDSSDVARDEFRNYLGRWQRALDRAERFGSEDD
jgi:hypothetical protein